MIKKFLIGTFAVAALALALTVSAAYDFGTTTLKVGSKGAAVKSVQTLVGATADGNFGKMTAAKVKVWQAANGLTADGVFGKASMAKANSGETTTTTTTTTTGATCPNGMLLSNNCAAATVVVTTGATCPNGMLLSNNCAAGTTATTISGGAGNISSTTLTGSPSNVQVGEGATGVAVLGFEVRADAGSDLNIQNVRVNLAGSGPGSTWPSRYIAGLSVWQGSTKVGSVTTANLSQNGTTYNATIALTGAVVKANATSDFTVSVDANSSIDSNDANESFNVYVDSIRYADASGAILTSSYASTAITQPMRFLKLSASASTKLTLSEDATNPKDRTITANYTSTTNDVSLLKFNLKADGSDMWLGSIALPATATGVTDASQISDYFKLKYNGRVISSFTIQPGQGTTPTITFGDDTVTGSTLLDGSLASVFITAGTVASFEVVADVKAMCSPGSVVSPCTGVTDTEFDAGDTLKIDFPSSTITDDVNVYVEDQTGSQLPAGSTNRTGSATGYNATFRVQGLSASYVGNTFTPTKNTSGVLTSEAYTTTVAVTAVGNDFFINPAALLKLNTLLSTTQTAGLADTSVGFNVAILNGSNQYVSATEVTAASVATSVTCTSGCSQQSLTSMKIPANTTATFVISTTLTDTSSIVAGGYKVAIFSTNATDGSTMTAFPNTPVYNFITPISPDNFQ